MKERKAFTFEWQLFERMALIDCVLNKVNNILTLDVDVPTIIIVIVSVRIKLKSVQKALSHI